jgi:hypothetical protein
MTHSSKPPLVPLNFTDLGWSRRNLRASEEHFVVLGKVLALVTKIRFPAVLGHRIFVRAPKRDFGSCKFLPATKLIPFIGCTESKTRTVQTKHVQRS